MSKCFVFSTNILIMKEEQTYGARKVWHIVEYQLFHLTTASCMKSDMCVQAARWVCWCMFASNIKGGGVKISSCCWKDEASAKQEHNTSRANALNPWVYQRFMFSECLSNCLKFWRKHPCFPPERRSDRKYTMWAHSETVIIMPTHRTCFPFENQNRQWGQGPCQSFCIHSLWLTFLVRIIAVYHHI